MKKRFVVKLSLDERSRLEALIKRGREAAYRRRHAEVLLLVDEGEHGPRLIDRVVAERTGFSRRTVEQIRERCVIEGLDLALERKPRSRERSQRLDGEGEARLISLACSDAPMPQWVTLVGPCTYYRTSSLSWALSNPSLMNVSVRF